MKSLKKILAAFMAIMLAFSLAACQEEEETEVAPAGTTAIGTGALKIGVLYTSEVPEVDEENEEAVEEAEDAPLNADFMHRNGIATMQGYLGVPAENVTDVNGLDPKDTEAFDTAIADLAGCHVIVATSVDYLALVEAAAAKEEYKGIVFAVYVGNAGASSTGAALPTVKNTNNNLMLFGANMQEAAYLSGIAAGMKAKETKNNTIGYVAPADNNDVAVTWAVNAFALGAQSVNSKATVKVAVAADWTNEEAVAKSVKALEAAKCGTVAKYVETDEDALCATVWHMENAYITIFNTIARGEWTPENYFGGIEAGVVDVRLGADAAKGTKEAVKDAKAEIMDTEFAFDVADASAYVKGVSLLK